MTITDNKTDNFRKQQNQKDENKLGSLMGDNYTDYTFYKTFCH